MLTKTLTFLLALPLAAQQFTFSPQPDVRGLHATIWSVTACGPPAGAVTVGTVHGLMVSKDVVPISHDIALGMIHLRNWQSWPQRLLRYSAYGVSIAAFAATTKQLSAKQGAISGLQFGSGTLQVLTALFSQNLPPPQDIERNLFGPAVSVSSDGCAEFVVLSAPSKAAAWTITK